MTTENQLLEEVTPGPQASPSSLPFLSFVFVSLCLCLSFSLSLFHFVIVSYCLRISPRLLCLSLSLLVCVPLVFVSLYVFCLYVPLASLCFCLSLKSLKNKRKGCTNVQVIFASCFLEERMLLSLSKFYNMMTKHLFSSSN